jgi:hypothetical protein
MQEFTQRFVANRKPRAEVSEDYQPERYVCDLNPKIALYKRR